MNYSLEDLINLREFKQLDPSKQELAKEIYGSMFEKYDQLRPYNPTRLPGLVGINVHQLNRVACAYGAARLFIDKQIALESKR